MATLPRYSDVKLPVAGAEDEDRALRAADGGDGVAEGDPGSEVEGQRYRRKLSLVID